MHRGVQRGEYFNLTFLIQTYLGTIYSNANGCEGQKEAKMSDVQEVY